MDNKNGAEGSGQPPTATASSQNERSPLPSFKKDKSLLKDQNGQPNDEMKAFNHFLLGKEVQDDTE